MIFEDEIIVETVQDLIDILVKFPPKMRIELAYDGLTRKVSSVRVFEEDGEHVAIINHYDGWVYEKRDQISLDEYFAKVKGKNEG